MFQFVRMRVIMCAVISEAGSGDCWHLHAEEMRSRHRWLARKAQELVAIGAQAAEQEKELYGKLQVATASAVFVAIVFLFGVVLLNDMYACVLCPVLGSVFSDAGVIFSWH